MASPSGLSAQGGWKTETTWGTGVVVDKFMPLLDWGIKNNTERMDVKAALGGRLVQHKWAPGLQKIGGPVKMYLPNVTIASLLKHCFGAVATTGAGPYTHTLTPASVVAQSMTMQGGVPDVTGTVQPFTYAGCKFDSWEIAATVGDFAQLSLDVTAKSETTATGLATATYASGWMPFTFIQSAISIAGSPATKVHSVSLKGNRKLSKERGAMGSAQILEQVENDMFEFTGAIPEDFSGLTDYNRFVNGTESALVLTFSNGTDSLTITMNVRYDGETPGVSGFSMVEQPLPFKCVSGTSDAAAITAVLINTDATAA